MKITSRQRFCKRLFDFFTGAVLLILFIPLFVIIALAVKISSPGEIIFRQSRAGEGGNPFLICKFRTMVKDAQLKGAGIYFEGENDPRLTRVGRFLRNYSLDELPELYNIVRGEMSLVGPRPMLMSMIDCLSQSQRKRLTVRPGITGWAQINGRNSLPWSKRIELDLWYIQNFSFWLDIKILCKTIIVVLFRKGIRYDQKPSEVEDWVTDKGGKE